MGERTRMICPSKDKILNEKHYKDQNKLEKLKKKLDNDLWKNIIYFNLTINNKVLDIFWLNNFII